MQMSDPLEFVELLHLALGKTKHLLKILEVNKFVIIKISALLRFSPELIEMNLVGIAEPGMFSNATCFVDESNEPAVYLNNASTPLKVDYLKTREVEESIAIEIPAILNRRGI